MPHTESASPVDEPASVRAGAVTETPAAASNPVSASGSASVSAETGQPELPEISNVYIVRLALGSVGASMAYVVPLSYSLAIRIQELAPGHEQYLGYLTGMGGVVSLVSMPFVGMLSDRTRSRLGRRRPYLIGGALLGLVALLVLALAPTMPVLAGGWALAVLGWQAVLNATTNLQADKLPEQQRGKVSGYTGFAGMLAPVLGVGIAAAVATNNLLLLLVPGVIGLALLVPLAIWTQDADSRAIALPNEKFNIGLMFGKYVFNPRRHPDFAWNWLGRFVFYFGMTFNTTFMAYFLAQRLGISLTRIGGLVAVLSLIGVVATMVGSVLSGLLSDRLRRRRVFVLLGGVLFGLGAAIMVLSSGFAGFLVGGTLANLGLGLFAVIDQAVFLDTLPSRAEAGRFVGIIAYAQEIPRALAPLAASALLGVGVAAGQPNYSLLYLVGGGLTAVGGVIIMLKVKGSR